MVNLLVKGVAFERVSVLSVLVERGLGFDLVFMFLGSGQLFLEITAFCSIIFDQCILFGEFVLQPFVLNFNLLFCLF